MKKCGLVLFTLLAGLGGYGLRLWRFGFRSEATGLLEKGGVAAILLLAWTVLVAAAILLLTKKEAPRAYAVGIPGRISQAVLCAYLIFSGVWTLLSANWTVLSGAEVMGLATAVLGLLAAFCGLGVIAGWKGNHILLCLYVVVLLISRFRGWSRDPQIEKYAFQLLAAICLMLATYHRAAFDLGRGSMKAYRRWSLLGAYCALVALSTADWVFFGVAALWLLSNQLLAPETSAELQ